MLPLLATMWGGHLSVAYRIQGDPASNLDTDPHLQAQLGDLDILLKDAPRLAELADFHLIIDDLPIQFNLWRNIARLYSPARSVLALDVDFFPDKDLHSFILRNWEALLERMVSQKILCGSDIRVRGRSPPLANFH